MKKLTTLISALFFLVIGVSQVWALPACPSSGYFDNCYGTYVWEDGQKYVGDWKDDKQHGQGTLTSASGNKYVGEYKDSMWHGHGTLTWTDGNNYVGEFNDGKRHGQGTFTYADGSKYVGEYKDSKKHVRELLPLLMDQNTLVPGKVTN